MVLVWEKGRMMVGFGRERGRNLALWRDPHAEWEGVEVGVLARLSVLGECVELHRELSSCLMATYACKEYVQTCK